MNEKKCEIDLISLMDAVNSKWIKNIIKKRQTY